MPDASLSLLWENRVEAGSLQQSFACKQFRKFWQYNGELIGSSYIQQCHQFKKEKLMSEPQKVSELVDECEMWTKARNKIFRLVWFHNEFLLKVTYFQLL